MIALLSLLKRFWWVPVAAGLYFYGDWHGTQTQKRIHTAYVAARDLRETEAVDKALAAQKAAADAAEARNALILEKLNDREKELSAVAGDRDLARRLLARAAAAASSSVPTSQGGQTAANPSGASSDGSLAETVAAAIGECRRNADRLDALIAEITPQL